MLTCCKAEYIIIADLIKADDEKSEVIRERVKESKTIMICSARIKLTFGDIFLKVGQISSAITIDEETWGIRDNLTGVVTQDTLGKLYPSRRR